MNLSKLEDEAKKLEIELKKLGSVAESDLAKMEGATKKWGWYYIALVLLITILSGFFASMIDDLWKFLVEVLPATFLSLILGLLFLRRSDETVKTTTEIVHKALSHENAELHSKIDRLLARVEQKEKNTSET